MVKDEKPDPIETVVGEYALVQIDAEKARAVQASTLSKALIEGTDLNQGAGASLRFTKFEVQLPPPDLLVQYEEDCPGLGKEIIEDWKAERAHRRELDRMKVENQYKVESGKLGNERIHLWGLLFMAAAGLAIFCLVALGGHTIPATALVLLEFVLGLLIYRHRSGSKSLEGGQ